MKWLAPLLLLTACGTQEPLTVTRRSTVVQINDETVRQYVDEFKQRCIDLNHQTCLNRWSRLESVLFVEQSVIQNEPNSEDRVGVCYIWEDEKGRFVKAQVQLLRGDWDEIELRGLIYHELGHCVLGLDHVVGTRSRPTIMNPYLYHAELYLEFWDQMLSDLFSTVLNLWSDSTEQSTLTVKVIE